MNENLSLTVRLPWRLVVLALAVWMGMSGAAFAQEETPSSTSYEFWPETDIWWRLNPAWRLSMFVPLTQNVETKYREGNLILQADFGWGRTKSLIKRRMLDEDRAREMKVFLARGGYNHGQSLDDHGAAYLENMLFFEFHVRNPLKRRILLSHRFRADFRWLGDDRTFSTRYRYRLMVEKEYLWGRTSIVPYVNIEPFYDSRYDYANRVRYIGGATVAWKTFFAIEANFTYQHDKKSSVTNLYALNVILHIFF
jgi:hypothetical protein